MSDIVCIKIFSSRIEANIAKSKLESKGIQSIISADDEGGMLPFQFGKAGVKLLVKHEELKIAQKLLL